MNLRLAALSTSLIALASTLSPAYAAEGRGARFNYAPNIFPLEEPRMPKQNYSVAPAAGPQFAGKVPHGPSFLGLEPQMLVKPQVHRLEPLARPQTQVAMHPSSVPTSFTNSPFRPAFGR